MPADFPWGKSVRIWEDNTTGKLQAGQEPWDTTAKRQLKMVNKTRAELRCVMWGSLTRCALAISYCNGTNKAYKYFGHLTGLCVVLFFVESIGWALKARSLFSNKENKTKQNTLRLLNWFFWFITCTLCTVCMNTCMCTHTHRKREKKKKPWG